MAVVSLGEEFNSFAFMLINQINDVVIFSRGLKANTEIKFLEKQIEKWKN